MDIDRWFFSQKHIKFQIGELLTKYSLSASSFNQDLRNWDVSKVTLCTDFSYEATAWTEPKPTFTNCSE